MPTRRDFCSMAMTGGVAVSFSSLLPGWAQSSTRRNTGLKALSGNTFDLLVKKANFNLKGRTAEAVTINGTLPAPLLRFREGEEVTLNVTNGLNEDTSIHWHGLLLPFLMDGVPGVSFPGIRSGETFSYRFKLKQSGTYWYHSHSGLQEQLGHYGPLIIDPAGTDSVAYDREYVLVLSDWSFESPHRIFSKLKKMSDSYNFNQRTLGDFTEDIGERGLRAAFRERVRWGNMRMNPRDLTDVSGATYTYLVNGHGPEENWTGLFTPGERVRLRIINASAMTLFNVRIPGLPMTIVASDGLNVQPFEVDEFQMGVAETYDVIIEPKDETAFAFVAESIDRSGMAIATLTPNAGMLAEAPALRSIPSLTMTDMGMGAMVMSGDEMSGMDHSQMDHAAMGHSDMSGMDMREVPSDVKRGPGVVNVATTPISRLSEPGIGLENIGHRILTYADLRALEPNPDLRPPGREIELHLTSNMERYMWSFNGVRFADITDSIKFYEGERLRLVLINDTMMPHPIHLHGMFFELNNGGGDHRPRKHTIVVKPGERLSVDITADAVGDWAFHCHLLYHMHAGMMQVVSVLPNDAMTDETPEVDHDMMDHSKMDHGDMG